MKQRRQSLLVNRRFQIKFSFFVVSWIFALSMVYPLITHTLFEYFISFLKIHAPQADLAGLETVKTEFLRLLILLHVVFITVIFLISLFMSHKIAGPLYKLRKCIADAKNGNYDVICRFRKYDHFSELADDFNDLMESFKDRQKKSG